MARPRRDEPAARARGRAAPLRRAPVGRLPLPRGCLVEYVPRFMAAAAADAFLAATLDGAWARRSVALYGKTILEPRETAFYGTEMYTYTGAACPPIPWDTDAASRAIFALKGKVEARLGLEEGYFNVCLCNKYTDGARYMGYHSDDEASLGANPVIASISCGAERRFLLRPKPHALSDEVDDTRWEYVLGHGSLLVMSGATQEYYKHSLPKMASVTQPRVNITYRRVVNPERGAPREQGAPPR